MDEVSLTDLRAFVAVARHRSFRGAADTLGVSRSSLSHALRALERRLGVRLLHRTTRSVALTEAGARLLERLSPALGELDDMLDAVRSDAGALSGPLRINANEGGARWLIRHVVPDFVRAHPPSGWISSPKAGWSISWRRGSTPGSGSLRRCRRT
jgi:DNA-binding transcriptional LysR family regulator